MQCKALEKELAAHRSKPLARYHHIFQVEDKKSDLAFWTDQSRKIRAYREEYG
jgi:hypothetical protein